MSLVNAKSSCFPGTDVPQCLDRARRTQFHSVGKQIGENPIKTVGAEGYSLREQDWYI